MGVHGHEYCAFKYCICALCMFVHRCTMFCVSLCSIIEMGGGHVVCGIWCTHVCCVLGYIYSVRNVAFAICTIGRFVCNALCAHMWAVCWVYSVHMCPVLGFTAHYVLGCVCTVWMCCDR